MKHNNYTDQKNYPRLYFAKPIIHVYLYTNVIKLKMYSIIIVQKRIDDN